VAGKVQHSDRSPPFFYVHCRPKFHFMLKDEGSKWQSFIIRQMDLCAGTETSAATHCSSNQSPRKKKIFIFFMTEKWTWKQGWKIGFRLIFSLVRYFTAFLHSMCNILAYKTWLLLHTNIHILSLPTYSGRSSHIRNVPAGRSRVRFAMLSLRLFNDLILPAALRPWSRLSL